jgi:hypothetical protein
VIKRDCRARGYNVARVQRLFACFMSDTPDHEPVDTPPEREFDRTGFYPVQGKAFRVWALLAWNLGVIIALALIAALINYLVLDQQ